VRAIEEKAETPLWIIEPVTRIEPKKPRTGGTFDYGAFSRLAAIWRSPLLAGRSILILRLRLPFCGIIGTSLVQLMRSMFSSFASGAGLVLKCAGDPADGVRGHTTRLAPKSTGANGHLLFSFGDDPAVVVDDFAVSGLTWSAGRF